MSAESQEEALNRLMQAFRSELDEYARELLSETPRSASKPTNSRKQVDWDDKHDRYYSPGTPRSRSFNYEEDEEPRTVGVQTPNPHEKPSTPPLSRGQYRTPPHSAQQKSKVAAKSLFTDWKAHMNKIVDTIEERDSRTKALEEENEYLAKEIAALKEEMDRLHATKVKPLLTENDDLRAQVDDLKMKLVAANDQAQNKTESLDRELENVQVKLRESRKDCAALERQNDQLQDRLAELKSQTRNNGYSSSSVRYGDLDGDRGSRYLARDYEEEPYRREAPEPRSSSIPEPWSRRYASSPGEALVRDLAEKTHLDRDYLEPLSDILDRRLGRETPGKHTPGRNNGGRYGRLE